jgi:tRNA splicing endonuclease
MYSHYQSGGGAALPSASTTTTATAQLQLQWNGTQWVQPQQQLQVQAVLPMQQQQQQYDGNYQGYQQQQNNSNNNSYYQQPQQTYMQQPPPQQPMQQQYALAPPVGAMAGAKTNSELVQLYTQYYHQWMALHAQYSTAATNSNTSSSDAQWAKYHADCASRAAHYFHSNPIATIAETLPAELILPPAPPPQQQQQGRSVAGGGAPAAPYPRDRLGGPAATTTASGTNAAASSADATTTTTTTKSGDMKRYLDRCLVLAGPEHKHAVMKGFQQIVQDALASGTLHVIDWEHRPLITIDGGAVVGGGGASGAPSSGAPFSSAAADVPPPGNLHSFHGPRGSMGGPPGSVSHDHDGATGYYGPQGNASATGASTSVPAYQRQGGIGHAGGGLQSGGSYLGGGTSSVGGESHASESGYYGPTSVAGSVENSGGGGSGNSKSSKKRSLSKARRWDASSNNDSGNYYGPSGAGYTTNSVTSEQSDFISVPSYNKALTKKKMKSSKRSKQETGGFDQTDWTLANRASRFSGPGGVEDAAASKSNARVNGENWDKYMGKTTIGGTNKVLDEQDYERMTVKGTCTVLEKSYLRLTAPPRPELVRPEPILKQHLRNLKAERDMKVELRRDYLWFCSQLKAIRQDCTVQRIQNAFAVDVYETHALLALEERDMNEYNQCQTQLKYLYALMERDSRSPQSQRGLQNRNEFMALRLIYFVFLSVDNDKYDSSEMLKVMDSFTHQQLEDPMVQHALAVRGACCSDLLDYHLFFRLRKECPSQGASHLMERIVPPLRYKALQRICKGYRPTSVDTVFVLKELGFDVKRKRDVNLGRKWLHSCGCVLSEDGWDLVTKDTTVHESNIEAKQSLI